MRFHASCAAWAGAAGLDGVLILGPSGSGKSDMVLRLIDRGWRLVADDQVLVEDGMARAPDNLAGMLEVRGLGLFRLPYVAAVRLRLVVRLDGEGVRQVPRLPEPDWHEALALPQITLDPAGAAAPARLALALEAACGRVLQVAGAFAA